MCGLLILKHLRNLSDESVVEQWSESAYYQYFCGLSVFTASFSCNASEFVRFRNHPKNRKKALKADRRIRTIAGRLVRELERNLGEDSPYKDLLSLFIRVLQQKKKDKNKVYLLQEPEVECISKGKRA